jgi:hypothetical protein
MFSTKGQEVKGGGVQKSIQPGVVYAHIYSGALRTSNKGDKKVLELVLETPAINGFEGWAIDKNDLEGPKFKGQSSKVTATVWTDQFDNPNASLNEIMSKLVMIAKALGLKDQVDNINASSIDEWVKAAIQIVSGKDLYFFIKGTEEEYNGKTIVKLSLPKYKFAANDEAQLDKFDKNNQYHYKALAASKPVAGFQATNDFDI